MNDDTSLNTTLQFDFILHPNVTNSSDSLGNMTYLPNPLYTYYSNSNFIPDTANTADTVDTANTADTADTADTVDILDNLDNLDNAYNSDLNQIV